MQLWDFFSWGLKNEFETAVVNEPSVFEPLKFYCILCVLIKIASSNLQLWDFFKGLKIEFETAVVNEPSVFEPVKFYCNSYITYNHDKNLHMPITVCTYIIVLCVCICCFTEGLKEDLFAN